MVAPGRLPARSGARDRARKHSPLPDSPALLALIVIAIPLAGTTSLRRTANGWQALDSLNVVSGDVFKTGLRLRGRTAVRAQVGGQTSLAWRQRG